MGLGNLCKLFLFLSILTGCITGFSYRYYGLSGVSYEQGKLLGPTDKDDLPFSKCAPGAQVKNPCVVMLSSDFFALRQDYQETQLRLAECEKK